MYFDVFSLRSRNGLCSLFGASLAFTLGNNLVGWKRLLESVILSEPESFGAFADGDDSLGDESRGDESRGDESLGDESRGEVNFEGGVFFEGEYLAFFVGDGDKSKTLSFMELLLRISLTSFCLAGDIKVFCPDFDVIYWRDW